MTSKNWKSSLRHAAIITTIGIFIIFGLGYAMGFKALSMDWSWILTYVVISVPIQELFFRGFIQTRLYRFGTEKAVVIASVIFAAIHFAVPVLVLLTLAAGLAWGYSFSRHGTLAGPIASHVILGLLIFIFVL